MSISCKWMEMGRISALFNSAVAVRVGVETVETKATLIRMAELLHLH